MWILIVALLALALVAAVAGILRDRKLQRQVERGELDAVPEVNPVDMECCGQHEVCEKESLLAAVSKQIEYYDDEELDRSSVHRLMDIRQRKRMSSAMFSTPCRRKTWPDGCAACNCGALRCRTI